MISISYTVKENRFDETKNFRFHAKQTPTINDLCRAVCDHTWSPIVFKNDYRKGENFLSASYLVLDFDEGLTIDEFKQWASDKGYKYILGASRNHQVDKITKSGAVKPACDRFRVIMPFERTIENRWEYVDCMRAVMAEPVLENTDPACKDAARFFFPCQRILEVNGAGKTFPILKPEIKQSEIARASVEKHEIYRDHGVMGIREIKILRRGYTEQGRGNPTILRLARNLTLQGFSEERIREELIKAGFDKASAWERAMERGIEYAWQAIAVAEENQARRDETKGHQADTDRRGPGETQRTTL